MSEHAPRSSLASCFRSIRKENFYLSPCSMVGHHTHGSCAGLLMLSMTSISVTKLHGLSRSTTKVANLGCYAEGGSAVLVGDSIDCLVPGTSSFNREIVLEPKPSHQSWYLWPRPTIESTSHPSLPQKPQPLPQLLHPNYIPKRQTNPRPPFAPPLLKPPPIPHQPQFATPSGPSPSSTTTSAIPCKQFSYTSPVETNRLLASSKTRHRGRSSLGPSAVFAYTSSTVADPSDTVATTAW
ncbi:MAG: hypothetical protein FRX48_08346 [Lasallia pustulata]|uniref:Uncharacterized protein n=1 Tax=Lasallia pustulata TaxID=136370 RepID=A0A5M8PFI9_9LECA|nr:MAG: hypothetical protein FRX48_08346 [Lasallia pustulata]